MPPRARATFGPQTSTPSRPSSRAPSSLLEPLPLSPRANGEPHEPLVVMPVPKHPRAPGRLPRPRSGRLEADAPNAAPLERIGRREPGDPGADDGDLGESALTGALYTAHHFGPMNSSSRATDFRCEIEMFRGFDCVQRIPSSSQCSQKIRRMSSDRFEKK